VSGQLPGRYDIAVIGAGLVGCAAALELSKRKQRVILLDQGEVNRGASGRNAGSLHFQIEPRMLAALASNPERLAQLLPVNLQAIDDWRNLPGELNCDLGINMHGGLLVAETEAQRDLLMRKAELETRGGLAVRVLDKAELRRAAPYLSEHIRFASFCGDEGHANPLLVTAAYAAAAQARGVTLRLHQRVHALEARHGAWRVLTRSLAGTDIPQAAAEIDVGAVLIAAGAWSREILSPLGVDLPLVPVGLTMSVTQRAPATIQHLIQHIGRPLSMKQVEAGNVLIGGGWPACLPRGPNLGPDPDTRLYEGSLIGNAAAALHTVPGVGHLNILRSWSGIASVAPDHLPVLGAVASLPGVFVAAGGSSFTLGPTYARLIGELICRGTASLPTACYCPDRFVRPLSRVA
jgi:glycine/D-amino acid oxidase-like deaminating enzyme